jgi:hypothetical protein
VEFENGDVNYPIWVGCRLAKGNVPPLALASTPPLAPNIAIQSKQQHLKLFLLPSLSTNNITRDGRHGVNVGAAELFFALVNAHCWILCEV